MLQSRVLAPSTRSAHGSAAPPSAISGAHGIARRAAVAVVARATNGEQLGVAVVERRARSAALAPAPAPPAPPAPAPRRRPRDPEVLALFDTWNAALATGDPYQVADLYAPGAVLLPTVSNQYRRTRAEIVDYFANFLTLLPQGAIDSCEVRTLGDNVAQNLGIYTFTLGDGRQVQARFSFTYVRQPDGQWLIAEHHSSAMPENLRAEVLEAFERWNAALQSGNPEAVADLYSPTAVLLPTGSDVVRTTRDGIVDKFAKMLARRPRVAIEDIPGASPNIRFPSTNVAINSGTYVFHLRHPEATVRARYSFMYRKVAGAWLIEEHHSSAMPEGPGPAIRE